MKNRWVYILCLMLLNMGYLQAQELSIESRLDTNSILIGQQTKLNVEVQFPKHKDAQFNIYKDTLSSNIEVVELNIDTILDKSDWSLLRFEYTITSFDTGYYVIPPQVLRVNGQVVAETQAQIMAVNSISIDSKQESVFDIKEPIKVPWTISEFLEEYFSYIIISILLIGLLITLIWYLKKRKRKPQEEIKPVILKEAAHIIALRDLETLKDKKLWQNDRVKLYYIELTNILRAYLENRFKVSAMEQTSAEIMEGFQNAKHLSEFQLTKLRQILFTADMAKFAKAKPMPNENDLALKNAFEFVEETKIVEIKETKEVEDDV